MNNNQVLPVTAQQATESKISNSVKISKQLMKSELKKRKASVMEEYNEAGRKSKLAHEIFTSLLTESVEEQVMAELKNDGQITRFRNLFAKFSRFSEDDKEYPKFTDNLDMFKNFNITDITDCLFRGAVFDDEKDYTNFLLGTAELTVNLNIPDRPHSSDRDRYEETDIDYPLGYIQTVEISQEIRDMYHSCKELDAVAVALNNKYNEIDLKLKGIDEVAEEMEAQLLVNELNQSEEGKAALAIAGDLVGNMLGDKPALLNIPPKE